MQPCAQCGARLEIVHHTASDNSPLCPTCASRASHVNVFASDEATFHELASLKAKRAGEREPYLELKAGDSLEHRTGEWRDLLQRVDHDGDWYDKVVTEPTTGRVIHECHEALSEHRGRGSAKPKRSGGGAA